MSNDNEPCNCEQALALKAELASVEASRKALEGCLQTVAAFARRMDSAREKAEGRVRELEAELERVEASRKRWRTYGQAADEELAKWRSRFSTPELCSKALEALEARVEALEAIKRAADRVGVNRVRVLEAERVQLHDSLLALLGVVDEVLEDLGGLAPNELRSVALARAMLADDAARERECR